MVNWKKYISSDPSILLGKMVIKGTSIPVELILEKLASDYSFEALLKADPGITIAELQACRLFAADKTKPQKTLVIA